MGPNYDSDVIPPAEKITFKEMHIKPINWEAVAHRLYGLMSAYEDNDLKKICPEIYYQLFPVCFIKDDSLKGDKKDG